MNQHLPNPLQAISTQPNSFLGADKLTINLSEFGTLPNQKMYKRHRSNLSHRDVEGVLASRGLLAARKIVTDKVRSYNVAHKELISESFHDTSQYANNSAELSRSSSQPI
ncbi:MAG: hypothetical protein ACI8XU_002153 [Kiritimatiellia bacterium]|jgi:hypothetical protein